MTTDGQEYPARLLSSVESLETLAVIRARAAAGPDDLVIRERMLTDYVALALASGVIGNVGHDLIKLAWKAWRRPRVTVPAAARGMRDAALIAVLATQARCAQVDLAVPALDDLEVVACERKTDHWRVELRRADRRQLRRMDRTLPDGIALAATVVIPDGPLRGRDVEVTVVAKGEVDNATRAELDRVRAMIQSIRDPENADPPLWWPDMPFGDRPDEPEAGPGNLPPR